MDTALSTLLIFKHVQMSIEKQEFDLENRFASAFILKHDLKELKGIILGIQSDGDLDKEELNGIQQWINSRESYADNPVYISLLAYLKSAIANNFMSPDEREEILYQCDAYTVSNNFFDVITGSIYELRGIMGGIAMDGIIQLDELLFLKSWLERHAYLKNTSPYDEIYNFIAAILEDEVIVEEERQDLLRFCEAYGSGNKSPEKIEQLISLIQSDIFHTGVEIIVPGSKFRITGIPQKYKKNQIAESIQAQGGYVVATNDEPIDYLVVCTDFNHSWPFASYGSNVNAALKLRQEGAPISIIHENDLYRVLHPASNAE